VNYTSFACSCSSSDRQPRSQRSEVSGRCPVSVIGQKLALMLAAVSCKYSNKYNDLVEIYKNWHATCKYL